MDVVVKRRGRLRGPITATTVVGWFRNAAGGPLRRRGNIPTEENVKDLVWTVNRMRYWTGRPLDPARQAIMERKAKVGRVKHRLAAQLPEVVACHQMIVREGGPDDEAARMFADLIKAAERVVVSPSWLGAAPKPNSRDLQRWHGLAVPLMHSIAAAWTAAGRKQVSLRADGPVVRVMLRAFRAIDPDMRMPKAETLATWLKQWG